MYPRGLAQHTAVMALARLTYWLCSFSLRLTSSGLIMNPVLMANQRTGLVQARTALYLRPRGDGFILMFVPQHKRPSFLEAVLRRARWSKPRPNASRPTLRTPQLVR